MRIKSQWFKSDREKTPQEIGGAMAFTIWRIADNALKNTRRANFEIAIGPQYFSFLTEFLVFLIQVAVSPIASCPQKIALRSPALWPTAWRRRWLKTRAA